MKITLKHPSYDSQSKKRSPIPVIYLPLSEEKLIPSQDKHNKPHKQTYKGLRADKQNHCFTLDKDNHSSSGQDEFSLYGAHSTKFTEPFNGKKLATKSQLEMESIINQLSATIIKKDYHILQLQGQTKKMQQDATKLTKMHQNCMSTIKNHEQQIALYKKKIAQLELVCSHKPNSPSKRRVETDISEDPQEEWYYMEWKSPSNSYIEDWQHKAKLYKNGMQQQKIRRINLQRELRNSYENYRIGYRLQVEALLNKIESLQKQLDSKKIEIKQKDGLIGRLLERK